MPDTAIKNAIEKRDGLSARIEKYERAIKRAKAQLIEIQKFINQREKFSGKTVDAVQQRVTASGNPPKEDVARVAEDILRSLGKTVFRAELYQELVKRGIKLQGKNPEMLLSTMLWRMRESTSITRLPGGGYALKDQISEFDLAAENTDEDLDLDLDLGLD